MFKIGLMGAHGTGKTTFLKEWIKKYPFWTGVSEVARECPFQINEGTTAESQEWILSEQIARELSSGIRNKVITDRTTIDQIAYIWHGCEIGNIPIDVAERLVDTCVIWAKTYDLVVYFPIEFDIENDGIRSIDPEYQKLINDSILTLIDEIHMPCIGVTGTVENRIRIVEEELKKVGIYERL